MKEWVICFEITIIVRTLMCVRRIAFFKTQISRIIDQITCWRQFCLTHNYTRPSASRLLRLCVQLFVVCGRRFFLITYGRWDNHFQQSFVVFAMDICLQLHNENPHADSQTSKICLRFYNKRYGQKQTYLLLLSYPCTVRDLDFSVHVNVETWGLWDS